MSSNYFTSAFDQIEKDNRLNPSHISIYVVLLNIWHKKELQNPMNISRKEILSEGKVKSKATYHKCMKELHEYGYIKYDPTYNPFKGSSITMIIFGEEAPRKKNNFQKRDPHSRFYRSLIVNKSISLRTGKKVFLMPCPQKITPKHFKICREIFGSKI